MTRVLMAVHHTGLMHTLRRLLEIELDINVVGEATTSSEALQLAQDLRPDVVIMDLNLSMKKKTEVTSRLVEDTPHIRTILLMVDENDDYQELVLRAGVCEIVLKRFIDTDLIIAIRQCLKKRVFMSGRRRIKHTERMWAMKPLIRTLAMMLLGMLVTAQFANAQITDSRHDLSTDSATPGAVQSTDTNEICVFCHTPHSNQTTTVLWNRTLSSATYNVYSSPSMEAALPQPGGASKKCLGCHDGTVAFNALTNSVGSGLGTLPTMTVAQMDTTDIPGLGTNLTNDHPVSFVYNTHQSTDGELRAASLVGGKVVVDNGSGIELPLSGSAIATATLECTSCHDPHKTSNGTFLRFANTRSAVCLTCHTK